MNFPAALAERIQLKFFCAEPCLGSSRLARRHVSMLGLPLSPHRPVCLEPVHS